MVDAFDVEALRVQLERIAEATERAADAFERMASERMEEVTDPVDSLGDPPAKFVEQTDVVDETYLPPYGVGRQPGVDGWN